MRMISGWVMAALCVFAASDRTALKAQQADPVYDEDSKLVSFEDLPYPPIALMGRVQGVVVVNVTLKGDGSVDGSSAISGSKTLIPFCLDNAKKWKFAPNRQKRAVIVYEFRIDDGACHDRQRNVFLLKHANFATIVACSIVVEG